jgi:beta-glucanase (GH16 family)
VVSATTEKLLWEDNFDTLDFTKWQHELTMSGGGNWEFEQYRNNRTNSFVKDGILHIQPNLSFDALGEKAFKTGDVNIWGGAPADECTSNAFYGCERNAAASGNYANPIMSARLRTVNSFSFKYGRVEIKAQLPKGDWIWPAMWFLPKNNEFGTWPASGEIDLVESRGNDPSCSAGGSDTFGSTLHYGPNWDQDVWDKTHAQYKHSESLGDAMHTYGLIWTEDKLQTYFDTEDNVILDVDFTKEDLWSLGGFPDTEFNPWVGETNNAPFNREFYFIFNVAVGGTNSYFPDGQCEKPWTNTDPRASNTFWNTKDKWFPSWNYPASHDSALKVDSVKVWEIVEGQEVQRE